MKQILVMMAAVVLVGCSNDTRKALPLPTPQAPEGEPNIPETYQTVEAEAQVTPELSPEPDPVLPVDEKLIVEKAVRKSLKKPDGQLTVGDLKKVTRLNVSDTIITDAGLKEVAKLQNLEVLRLGDTQITDKGLKDVAMLQKLTGLGLMHTKITDAGLKDVAKLQKLKTLSLIRTKVTRTGVAELQKALPKCNIHSNPKK